MNSFVRGLLLTVAVLALVPVPARAQDPAELTEGRRLYDAACASCHGADGMGSYRGPSLRESGTAASHFMLTTGRMPLDSPQSEMRRQPPAFSPTQIRQLLAYLETLGEGPAVPQVDVAAGEVARGGELYRLHCASCHGWSGNGAVLLGGRQAPPLQQSTPLQVAEAMLIGPGTMPVFGPGTFAEADADAIVAYVQYLQQQQHPGGLPLAYLGPFAEGAVAVLVGLSLLLLVSAWIGRHR